MAELESGYPVGLGKEMNEKRFTLPAVEVSNFVTDINPAFEGRLPLDLKPGKKSKLGLFLTPRLPKGAFGLEIDRWSHSPSSRAGIIGRALFSDSDGHPYRDILEKGGGHHARSGKEDKDPGMESYHHSVGSLSYRTLSQGSRGICDYPDALQDWRVSEKLYRLGIRVPRPIAIIKLNEVVDETGNKISVAEAKERDIIMYEEEPVVYLRAFGVETRFGAFISSHPDEKFKLLEDARTFVSQELGTKPEDFAYDDYLSWLAETMGKNLALFHKNGFLHFNLRNNHNFTLDGRIVDFDTALELQDLNGPVTSHNRIKDFDDAYGSLNFFLNSVIEVSEIKEPIYYPKYLEKFSRTYSKFFYEPK